MDDWTSFLLADNGMLEMREAGMTPLDSGPFSRRHSQEKAAALQKEIFGIIPAPPSKRIQLPSRQRKALHRRLAPSGAASAVYLRPNATIDNITLAGMHSERRSMSTKSKHRNPSMISSVVDSEGNSKLRRQDATKFEGSDHIYCHESTDMLSVNSGLTIDDLASVTTASVSHPRSRNKHLDGELSSRNDLTSISFQCRTRL